MPGGVNSATRNVPGLEELVVASTSGASFSTEAGGTYIDFHSGFGPPLLGHNHRAVDAAAASTAAKLDHMVLATTRLEVELSERLIELVPCFEQVHLTTSGSEATYHAIRLARGVTGRREIVKFEGCCHGWHDSIAMNVATPPERIGQKDPLTTGYLKEAVEATIVCPFNDAEAVEDALRDHDVAAVIVEPIAHNMGCVMPEPGFLEALRASCTEHGTVLIFDEVITGLRHGPGGVQEVTGVVPDLTTLGKALANGYPMGAIGGRADLMSQFVTAPGGTVFFAAAFNGHPATVAAALAVLDVLAEEPVHEHVFALGDRARQGLQELAGNFDVPITVAAFGPTFIVYFLDQAPTRYEDLYDHDDLLFRE